MKNIIISSILSIWSGAEVLWITDGATGISTPIFDLDMLRVDDSGDAAWVDGGSIDGSRLFDLYDYSKKNLYEAWAQYYPEDLYSFPEKLWSYF